jgi:cbb3-type cytochrome oxidase cytochrome c subunit
MVSYLLTLDYNDVDLAGNPSASPASLGESEKKKRQEVWDDGLVTTNVSEIDNDPEKKKILDEITTFYLRSRHGTAMASDLLKGSDAHKPMSTSEKLELVGHRLVRRYGCFGCHNGIKDIDPDPTEKKNRLEAGASARLAYFDGNQPIGAELNKWGNKGSDRLDFGQWGHQEDGSEAIPHQRHAWARAKLSDTRQFDVLPRRVLEGKNSHGKQVYKYLPTSQLAHKGADELLKMPLFPFHDKPEQVEAVVSYVISLVDDPVDPTMKKNLSAREKTLEAGSRLVQKLNCSGCHRIGATTSYVALDNLPNPNGTGDETGRINAMQAETWLARDYRLAARPAGPAGEKLGIPLPAGFVLGQQLGQYSSGDKMTDEALLEVFSPNEDPMSLVDVARRHFNPLPGFVQDLVMAIDSVVNEEEVADTLANVGIFKLVKKPPAEAASLVEKLRKAYEDESSKLGGFLVTMLEAPYEQDLDALGGDLGVSKADFELLARQYYSDGVLAQRPLSEQKLAVKGYGEGGVRFYSGTSLTDRFKAPPPLLRQGERVKSDWFFHFLKDVQPIRPWLKIRMPSFNLTQEEARLIVKWFKLVNEVPYGDEIFTEDHLEVDQALKGQLLFGKGTEQEKGKQCSQCHPRGTDLPTLPILTQGAGTVEPAEVPLSAPGDSHFLVWKDAAGKILLQGGFGAPADAQAAGGKLGEKATAWAIGKPWDKSSWGPDLGQAAERLRVQWMRDWLYFPPDFMPGTKMPNYFQERKKYTGKTDSEIDAKELADVNALLQYLRHMNDAKIATSAPGEPEEESGGGQ